MSDADIQQRTKNQTQKQHKKDHSQPIQTTIGKELTHSGILGLIESI